ncbi:hypothetical protein FPOA_00202 [Fusarium poae]|uniref:Uncharacterized protein n=1 Tax=Fusarium poae TaxID=36050 RepID=A0A1B8B0N4_FUSPO|nr:hypothetical protein FPOA_00202 [Fusarium poae]
MPTRPGSLVSETTMHNVEDRMDEEPDGCCEEGTCWETTHEQKGDERYHPLQFTLQLRPKQIVTDFDTKPEDIDEKATSEQDAKERSETTELTQSSSTATTTETNDICSYTEQKAEAYREIENCLGMPEEMKKNVLEMLEQEDWEGISAFLEQRARWRRKADATVQRWRDIYLARIQTQNAKRRRRERKRRRRERRERRRARKRLEMILGPE